MATKRTAPKRESKIDPNETKEQRFIRLATRRVTKARKSLDAIGQLGAGNYASTEDQRNRMSEALRESLEFNLNRLNKAKTGKADFRF